MPLIEGRYSPTPDNPLTSDKIDAVAMDANRRLLIAVAGEDLAVNVLKVEQRFSYANISTATTTTIKSDAGLVTAHVLCR